MYGHKAWTIVGYTFAADTYCADDCVITALGEPLSSDCPTIETELDRIADAREIDRDDERSFDSDTFPKVIFASQVESDEERCGACSEPLLS
ncbi:hypothetical protein ACZ90_00390 [Streptomyces albus subsp. albus]|nr:hypothetical protein ACZ90_00390 [Streptomyces albus subsp. albus]